MSARLFMIGLSLVSHLPNLIWVGPPNPQFTITRRAAREDLARMRAMPRPLERPVVVLAGWRSPAPVGNLLTQRLCRATSAKPDDFLSISYPLAGDIEQVTERVIEQVVERFGTGGEGETVEVDVVAFSMGGLVARRAAMPGHDTRLRIRRLYTLATPHRGARLASRIAPDPASRDMRAGSDFLERLDAALEHADYDLICYAHLNDRMVGARNTSPPGIDPFWVSGTIALSHYTTTTDVRIRADIARRLRGEEPHAKATSTPPMD